MANKKVVEVENVTPVEELKPTLEKGNYLVEIISEGQIIKRLAVANSEINITKFAEGGLAVDLM